MTYLVGLGLLLDSEVFNSIRELQIKIANAVANTRALHQPPHITIKRPFAIDNLQDVARLSNLVGEQFSQTAPLQIQYSQLQDFGTETLVLEVKKTPALQTLHETMLEVTSQLSRTATQEFEGQDIRFHTTLATSLDTKSHKQARALCESLPLLIQDFYCSRVGLFFSEDQGQNWLVLREFKLGKTE